MKRASLTKKGVKEFSVFFFLFSTMILNLNRVYLQKNKVKQWLIIFLMHTVYNTVYRHCVYTQKKVNVKKKIFLNSYTRGF